jgi:dipicolinate synthase subunit A
MLTGVYAMVVGGDERQLEVIDNLLELDAHVKISGFDLETERTALVRKVPLNTEECSSADVLILPITGVNQDGFVDRQFGSRPLQVTKYHIAALPQHAKVYCGMASDELLYACQNAGIECVELLRRDDFAILNSIPTAEGALAMAIEHTKKTIHHSNVIVLGFGRVGMTLARMLKALGAKLRVGVQFPSQYARAYEMNLNPFYTNDWPENTRTLDLLFNTIPSMIITAQVIANLNNETVIIDLASKPGGTDFRFAEKRNIKALLAPSLPGMVAPKTAGNIIATTLSRMISADLKERMI